MGFNRQIVKDNFERDVRAKIVETQQILRQLKRAIETVEKNSSLAKVDVKNAVDSITQQLANRQLELTQQIDHHSQPQIKSLQERIHAACVTLGSLQSTLNNLDSFDFSLVGLVEPTAPWPQHVNISLLTPEVEVDTLTDGIKHWGNVKVKGSENLTDDSSSSSSPVQLMDLVPDTLSKPFVSTTKLTTSANSANPTCSLEHRDSQIEKWLCGMRIRSVSNASDDFEMVPDLDRQTKSPDNINKVCSPLGNHCVDVGDKGSCCDGEDGSSIVCIETSEEVTVPSPLSIPLSTEEEDMSKWLKPKKVKRINTNNNTNDNNSNSSNDSLRQNIPSGTMQNYLYKSSKRNNSLDFPCLRLDPNAWVPKRQRNMVVATNVKRQATTSALSPDCCFQMGQNEIIPPTYALPYPFWLKKY